MRSLLIFLGVLLISPVSAFAINDSTITYCATTPQPTHCLDSFITFEKFYVTEYGKFLAAIANDPLAMSLPPAKADELARSFCAAPLLTGTPEHCRSTLAAFTPYAIGFMSWQDQLTRQRERGHNQQELSPNSAK